MPTKPQQLRRDALRAWLSQQTEGVTATQAATHMGTHYTTANDDLHILQVAGLVAVEETAAGRVWRAE